MAEKADLICGYIKVLLDGLLHGFSLTHMDIQDYHNKLKIEGSIQYDAGTEKRLIVTISKLESKVPEIKGGVNEN